MAEKDLIRDIRDIKYILDKAKVTFWLDYGTLLGAVRDRRIIPWDHDIDISSMQENQEKALKIIPQFKKKGFQVTVDYYDECGLRKIKLKRAKDYYIDILFLKKKGNLAWSYLKFTERKEKRYKIMRKMANIARSLIVKVFPRFNKTWVGKRITKTYFSVYKGTVFSKKNKYSKKVPCKVPISFYTKLDKIMFYGMEFNIPNRVKLYLSKRYGKNWRVPKKDWSYWAEDGFRDPDWVKKRNMN